MVTKGAMKCYEKRKWPLGSVSGEKESDWVETSIGGISLSVRREVICIGTYRREDTHKSARWLHRNIKNESGGYRLRSWGRIAVAVDDADDGYGERDKEFRIRFDNRVSFHANEHGDGTARIHFHYTWAKFSNVSGDRGSYWKFPARPSPLGLIWVHAESRFFYN